MPFSAVGKLFVNRSMQPQVQCSGALIDDTLLVTANHCLPWNQTDAKDRTTIEFVPAYDGSLADEANSRQWRSAYVTRCVGINPCGDQEK